MKKIYLNPTTDVVMIQTQQMMAGSFVDELDETGGNGEDALSRFLDDDGGDFLFDEEELFRFE